MDRCMNKKQLAHLEKRLLEERARVLPVLRETAQAMRNLI